MITSLGLLLATWIRRVGVAIAACVAIYVGFLIGWPIFLAYCWPATGGSRSAGLAMLCGDPPIGAAVATFAIARRGQIHFELDLGRGELFLATVFWIVMSGMAAAGLFKAAVATFDACMGRIPDEGMAPPTSPDEASPTIDELLERVPRSSEDVPEGH